MSIKSILSAYSGDASKGRGLRHALRIAKANDAWVTGVLRHNQSYMERTLLSQVPKALLDSFFEAEKARIEEVGNLFSKITAEEGWSDKSEFLNLEAADGITLSEFARSFDLIVTGVHSDRSDEENLSANPDLIALRSGRPVLVVPDGFEATALAEHALVAWDGKRSAARAIGDAMPMLEEKSKVTLVTVGTHEVPGTDMLLRNLERHGIDATLVLTPREKRVADTIMSTADKLSAKLIVMGAFEHSKFSHDVFGGVTTDVIRDSKVPVMLSH